MKKIILKNGKIGKQPAIFLEFPYDFELKELIKTFPGCTWDVANKTWWIPYLDNQINALKDFLEGKVWIDYSGFQKVDLPAVYDPLPPLAASVSGEIKAFEDWMRNKRYSESTIKTYTESFGIFIRFLENKPLESVGNEDLERFNKEYIIERKYSAAFQNQVVNAVKLFFVNRQNRKLDSTLIYRPKKEKLLPNVLSKEEVKMILNAHKNIKHRAMLSLIYACGLRRSELLDLKILSLDSKRGLLIVRQSKGKKDRVVPLSDKIILLLREYYVYDKPKVYLFEGDAPATKYSAGSLQKVLKNALKKSGIQKPVSLHWLRHSYATHLLENGTDLRYIQEILGHSSSKTTEIYTHVTDNSIKKIKSPFDDL